MRRMIGEGEERQDREGEREGRGKKGGRAFVRSSPPLPPKKRNERNSRYKEYQELPTL